MSRTRPTTEQVRFTSSKTGEHVLDVYMEAAELGGRTVPDLLQDIFQTNGIIREDLVEWRLKNGTLQTRVGDYVNGELGWRDVSKFFNHRGLFAPGTLYSNYETVTVADGSLHLVNGLAAPASYATETAFKAAHLRLINTAILDNYITSAEAAATAANTAKTAAETARTDAQTARTGAETARTQAQTAKTAAETARTGAETAQSLAETAKTDAQAANTSAQTAKTQAETARSGAVTARTGAETAQTGANAANTSAQAAKTAAEKAKTDAEAALAGVNGVLGDVVKTTGNQTIGGTKTFTGSLTPTGWVRLNMPGAAGEPVKELFYNGANGQFGFYDRTNSRWDLQIATNGDLLPRGSLDASNLSGTIDAARLPSTVVQTTGAQTITGAKTFTGIANAGTMNMFAAPSTSYGLIFRDSDAGGLPRAQVHAQNDRSISLHVYDAAGGNNGNLKVVQGGVAIASGGFQGNGSLLTALNASNLGSGTVPNARMVGGYSWEDLTLSGRLYVTGSNNWGGGAGRAGVQIEGTSPNIYFKQTDSPHSAMAGVNGTQFYVLNDPGGDGTFDSIALQVNLDGTGISYFGTALVQADTSVIAGNGLTGGGNLTTNKTITLGTPGSITDTSTNSVTATSHTHALSAAAVLSLYSDGTAGSVGTLALMAHATANTALNWNGVYSGSSLRVAGLMVQTSNAFTGALVSTTTGGSGTWRCLAAAAANTGYQGIGLFVRIS